ncbi:hypothetical protein [Nostoc sp.]
MSWLARTAGIAMIATIWLCHASVTHCKSLVDEVFPTCVYTVVLRRGD